MQENDAFSEHRRRLFWIDLRSLFSVSQQTSDIIVVPGTMNSVNKIPLQSQNTVAIIFCTYLTAGRSGGDNVIVSPVIIPTLRSENVWGLAFSDNKRYFLLLSVRIGAMTTRFFLPTNRRLILELPTYLDAS